MKYSQSLRYLNSFLNLERIQWQSPREWNLKRMQLLLDWAGHPEKNFFPILIAGTKGKGSTGYFLESILRKCPLRVGFYSSPHLQDPRERIRLQGKIISEKIWTRGIEKIKNILRFRRLPKNLGQFTYFEIMTLLALFSFQEQNIQIGIFEVGMGGRLDATNVLNPKLVLLTPIHLDHEAILGPTIAKIAAEKAAVIRPRSHVVIAPQVEEARKVIRKKVQRQKASAVWVQKPWKNQLSLLGDYQRFNAAVAAQAGKLLAKKFGYPVSGSSIREGLHMPPEWPGRFESFHKQGIEIVLDGAHNPVSIEALVRNLTVLYPRRQSTLIFGTSRDKKSDPMLKSLSRYFCEIYLTQAANPRSQGIEMLMNQARRFFKRIYPVASVHEAIKQALTKASGGSLIVITGSFYVIGEARKDLAAKN